jgi:tetratricopeptide (TPR) repeat protein
MRRYFFLVLLCAAPLGAAPKSATPSVTDFRVRAAAMVRELIDINEAAGDALYHDGKWPESIVAWQRITALDPQGLDAYLNAALLLWSTGRNAEATEVRTRMIATNPKNPEAYFEVGLYYFNTRNDAEAVTWLAKAVELGLPSPKRHLYGHALNHLGRAADAQTFWQRLAKEDPADEVARRELDKLTGAKPAPVTPQPETAPNTEN